jgi:hypothetical protein
VALCIEQHSVLVVNSGCKENNPDRKLLSTLTDKAIRLAIDKTRKESKVREDIVPYEGMLVLPNVPPVGATMLPPTVEKSVRPSGESIIPKKDG